MDIENFLVYLKTEKRSSEHTVLSYKNDLQQFSAFCLSSFEIKDFSEVTAPIVRSWMAHLISEKYKAASVHRKLSSINAWFKFLMKTGVCISNPAHGLKKPKLPGRLPVFIDESSTAMLYNQIHLKKIQSTNASDEALVNDFVTTRNELIVTLFYETGIRRAELIGLLDKDVDEYSGMIKVLGKRNKMRLVPLGKEMIQKIRDYKVLRSQVLPIEKGGVLFVTNTGQKINNSLVYKVVKSYLSDITTMKKKSPHVLRHTFATHMLNNGADLNVIKEILGHSSLAATQVYTHNSIEKLKSIHARMHPRNN